MTLERGPRRTFRRDAASRDDTLREIDEELRVHLEWVAEELIAEGWTESEANAEARRRFGDLEGTRAYCGRQAQRVRRRERWMMWWEDLWQDFSYAMRTLRRAPVYAGVVIATLAVGIAANTVVFSLMNPYLFRPLPFADGERLVQLGGVDPVEGRDGGRFSIPQIEEWSEASRTLDAIGGYYYGTVNLTGAGAAERRMASWFAGPTFEVLGTTPILGRTFSTQEAQGDGSPVVVLGERLWETRFGRDPGVVGTTLELDGTPTTVIGVMPADFTFPFGGLDLWLPVSNQETRADRSWMALLPVGRMADGETAASVEREISGLLAAGAAAHPELDGRYDAISVKGLRQALNFVWDILPIAFGLLLGAVSMVLIIACVNVASLTLARASARAREVAVRAAIGADRGRLVRQFVTESLVLALLGGGLGVLISTFVMRLLNGVLPPDLFRVGDISLDLRVLGFSAAVTLATPILFGFLPAWQVVRGPLAATLKEGARSGGSRSSLRARRLLVIAEVTLALVLVTGTGLMVRSLSEITRVETGFESEGLLTVVLSPSDDEAGSPEELAAFWNSAEDAIRSLPDVATVGTTSHLPLNHETVPLRFGSAEDLDRSVDEWPGAYTARVDAEYFDAMRTEMVAGSPFGADAFDAGSVIVGAGIADRLYGGRDAIGRTVLFGSASSEGEPVQGTIVGVVDDVRFSGLNGTERPLIYRPLDGSTSRRRFLTIRTRGEASAAIPAVRDALRNAAPNAPAEIRPMAEVITENTLLWSVSSLFLGVFGIVALGLAALGIYGLIAYSVMQRRREMGLRLALGADAGALQRGVVLDGLRLTGIGVAVGLAISLLVGSQLDSVLYGVSATDPTTLLASLGLFLVVATGASFLPARAAARANPLEALRDD